MTTEACQTNPSTGVRGKVFETLHKRHYHQNEEFKCLKPGKTSDIFQNESRKRPDTKVLLIFCVWIGRENSEDQWD